MDYLGKWYAAQVNGNWEHRYGVRITTLDNPGWSVQIDLVGTALENAPFKSIRIERSDSNWVTCLIAEGQFRGYCSPTNLSEVIGVFQEWSERF
ncbi:MAG: immunity 53 family protein [Candidatus Methylacidiphilales bacterium]|nr:immunity 53 family protein [Candidatus Methylacidiphilales bacterium]